MGRMFLRQAPDGEVFGIVETGGGVQMCFMEDGEMKCAVMLPGDVELELAMSKPAVAAGRGKELLRSMKEAWPKVGWHSLWVGDVEYREFLKRVNGFNKEARGERSEEEGKN